MVLGCKTGGIPYSILFREAGMHQCFSVLRSRAYISEWKHVGRKSKSFILHMPKEINVDLMTMPLRSKPERGLE
jgi:hypothetical protein